MIAREYRYDVDAAGRIRSAVGDSWSPTGAMVLDGVRKTTWLGPFEQCERDLLRVMASILDADRLSPRRIASGARAARDLAWQRAIRLTIAVEHPARWTPSAAALSRLLAFMTDDAWDLSFAAAERPAAQQILSREEIEPPTEIALFSGGMDSVAGLLARSRANGGSFIAVSACGNEVRGTAQGAALRALGDLGVRARSLRLTHQLRGTNRTRSRMESSQRSRGLLFLAMGAVVASHLRVPTFSIYETGTGCINLPTSSAQVGAQGTRAMHPRTLALFDELLVDVLDRPVRAVAPFFLHTKGELCREAGSDVARLVRLTMSCDEGEGHKTDAMEHCGLCTSCLFRRIALFSAGSRPDPTSYRDTAIRRHGLYELRAFENHAAELRACTTFADLLSIDPDARFARRLPLGDLTPGEAEDRVMKMYRRYADEIVAFLDQARPTVARRPHQPRKETERDLFAAVG